MLDSRGWGWRARASSTTQELELRLAEVVHQLAHLEALDSEEARAEAVWRRLEALATRHADARRTRIAAEAEVLPGPGRTPALTTCA